MRVLLIFLSALSVAVYLLFDQWLAPQLRGPDRISQILPSLLEEKLAPDKLAFSVSEAKIIEESDERVVVRFSYQGKEAQWLLNACGDITENRMTGPWGCQPRVLPPAANGVVDIGFVLVNGDTIKSRERECSDTLSLSIYGQDGIVFYRKRFSLEKVWHQTPGMWSWYRYRHEGCPLRK